MTLAKKTAGKSKQPAGVKKRLKGSKIQYIKDFGPDYQPFPLGICSALKICREGVFTSIPLGLQNAQICFFFPGKFLPLEEANQRNKSKVFIA